MRIIATLRHVWMDVIVDNCRGIADTAGIARYDAQRRGLPVPSKARALASAFALFLGWWAALAVCRIKGHDYSVRSHAGPESGSDHFQCKRCGHGFTHHYY